MLLFFHNYEIHFASKWVSRVPRIKNALQGIQDKLGLKTRASGSSLRIVGSIVCCKPRVMKFTVERLAIENSEITLYFKSCFRKIRA